MTRRSSNRQFRRNLEVTQATLWPERKAVDTQGLLIAEQSGEIGRPILTPETIVAGPFAARLQGSALRGDPLDMPPQLDRRSFAYED
jgi:hypothetical protein